MLSLRVSQADWCVGVAVSRFKAPARAASESSSPSQGRITTAPSWEQRTPLPTASQRLSRTSAGLTATTRSPSPASSVLAPPLQLGHAKARPLRLVCTVQRPPFVLCAALGWEGCVGCCALTLSLTRGWLPQLPKHTAEAATATVKVRATPRHCSAVHPGERGSARDAQGPQLHPEQCGSPTLLSRESLQVNEKSYGMPPALQSDATGAEAAGERAGGGGGGGCGGSHQSPGAQSDGALHTSPWLHPA